MQKPLSRRAALGVIFGSGCLEFRQSGNASPTPTDGSRTASGTDPSPPASTQAATPAGIRTEGAGALPWTAHLESEVNAGPVIHQGVVLASTSERIVAFDTVSGELLWKASGVTLGFPIFGQLAGSTAEDGVIYAFDESEEKMLQGSEIVGLDVKTGQRVFQKPGYYASVHDGVLYQEGANGLSAYDLEQDRLLWEVPDFGSFPEGQVVGDYLLVGDSIRVRSENHTKYLRLTSIDVASGEIVWQERVETGDDVDRFTLGGLPEERMGVVCRPGGRVYAVSPSDGSIAWETNYAPSKDVVPAEFGLSSGGRFYLLQSVPNFLMAFDSSTGEQLWDVAPRSSPKNSQTSVDGLTMYDSLLFFNDDAFTYVVDTENGSVRNKVAHPKDDQGLRPSTGPIISGSGFYYAAEMAGQMNRILGRPLDVILGS